MPRIDVAIVNWNTSGSALESAAAYKASEGVEVEVVIIDNASDPSERLILEDAGEGIEIVLGERNLGFGRAANLALADGRSEYVLVSNADVRPEPGTLKVMVDAFEQAPDGGLVGPVFREPDNYHDELPGPGTLLVRTVVGNFNRKRIADPAPGTVVAVGQPAGACLLTSRRAWEESGGFDERFFLWYEDVDLARKMSSLGRRNLVAGGAVVSHIGGESISGLEETAQDRLRLRSLNLYAGKYHPGIAWMVRFMTPIALATRRLGRNLGRAGGAMGESVRGGKRTNG